MQHVSLEASGQFRGIVDTDDALGRSGGLSSYLEGGQLFIRLHVFLPDLHDVDALGECRLQEASKIALFFASIRAQVELGEAEAGLQAHQHSHEATIIALSTPPLLVIVGKR